MSTFREHVETHVDVDFTEIVKNILSQNHRIKVDVAQLWCTECPSQLDTFEDFINHLEEVHNEVFDESVVGTFEVFNLADDKMSCLECGETFSHFNQLLKHTHLNHSEKHQKYLCEICGRGFAEKGSVVTHINQAHYIQKCKYCSETFGTCYALDKHVGTVHKVEKWQCPLCSEVLPNRYMKKRHMALVHDCKSVQLSCDVCHKIFTRNNKLLMHKRRVHLKEKNIACDECGLQFFNVDGLARHKLSHGDQRPFQCAVCKRTFRRRRALVTHVASNHAMSSGMEVPASIRYQGSEDEE